MRTTKKAQSQRTITTIDPNESGMCTLINIITVKPEQCADLLDHLRNMTNEEVVASPGFVSANVHVSEDRTRIVNYAQWRCAADLHAMLARNPQHTRRVEELSEQVEPRIFTVAFCAHPALSL